MEETQQHMRVEKKEVFIIASLMLGVLMLMALTSLRDARTRQKSQAQTPVEIGIQTLSPLSDVQRATQSASIDIRANGDNSTQVLYDAAATGEAAVLEFMDKNPLIDTAALSDDTQVRGVSTEGVKQRVLPTNFRQNSALSRTLTDKMFKNKQEVKHYYYTQKVKNIPVFGTTVRFDVAGNDKVVGVEGDYALSDTTAPVVLTQEQGVQKALERAKVDMRDLSSQANPVVCGNAPVSQKIYNEKVLGISSNETNHVVLEVVVCDGNDVAFNTFRHMYLVSLESGNILADGSQIFEAINRKVYNCKTAGCSKDRYGRVTASGSVTRAENQGPVGETDVDNAYDILGEIYNFYFNSFGRDGIDNRGGPLIGYVYAPVPNAQWDGTSMFASARFLGKDIWAHELTHGVTQYSSGLGPTTTMYQARALNESISDMFAYGVDSANWTMGETSKAGVIRDIANPSKFGQPERIFDSRFACNGEEHKTNGPTNKAFFLMTAGGTFNGCTINGIGKEKSLAVIYKANTAYLKQNSGFFDFNNKVNQACGDLYGASSAECANVAAAMQATELDQDRCGSGVSRKTPICAGGAQPTVGQTQPTAQPTPQQARPTVPTAPLPTTVSSNPPPTVPTGITGTPSRLASVVVSPSSISGAVDTQGTVDIQVNPGESQVVSIEAYIAYDDSQLEVVTIKDVSGFTLTKKDVSVPGKIVLEGKVTDPRYPITSTSTVAQVVFKVKVAGTAGVKVEETTKVVTPKDIALNLAIRFQGIDRAPSRNAGLITARIGITGEGIENPETKLVQLQADSSGIFYGDVSFPTVTPGKNYCVTVKGPLHSARKVCHTKPLEAQSGEYRRGSSTILLTAGANELDFTGIRMMVGDVDQNGVVNSFDLYSVRSAVSGEGQVNLDRCDVNFDNVCNGVDYALMVAAITVKTDEE